MNLHPWAIQHIGQVLFWRVAELDNQWINQCCRSGMFIPDPGSKYFTSRIKKIPDQKNPGSASASKNLSMLTPKFFQSSRKYDPGSGSWFFTHPGSRIQASKRQRIPDPQQWNKLTNLSNALVGHVGLVEENLAKMLPVWEDLCLSGQICSARIN
jgi:hypothetical protein